ncbi:Autoinducer 2 sensor kinase/phosphatase LuxQ [Bremerella volcania]|uniref:histidine kinase n=1 Tax=Bremerella volcania TaxID=2527984 RepID=A0A518C371_9BACT|nr:hybrid sensor histidine kinase/response regulator [Bremerella volcania]QDU73676.1 Autoinducer 2 sensor kinase/phosphatase LuxQ [Bremerella volcania]
MKYHFLIIDDSDVDRDAVISALRKDMNSRYRFTEVATGTEGLAKIESLKSEVDLVILDYRLPDMDARRFVELLLAESSIPPVPIVLVTGSIDSSAIDTSFLKRGVQDFFGKSQITEQILPRIARNAIERHKLLLKVVESERRAEQAMTLADQANRTKSQFLTSLSHELRTPLTAIIGFAEILQQDLGADDAQKMLAMISSSGEHLLELINDLLDIAKVEAGTLEVEPVPTDVRRLIEAVCELVKYRATANGLDLRWELPQNCPKPLRVDPVRLRQILINLLGNAIKFTDQGRIKCEADYDYSQQRLTIRVTDTGPGIPPEVVSRIFSPFNQGPTSLEKKRMGIGLGLSISRELATKMGGFLRLQETSSDGSTFVMELDAPECLEAQEHAQSEQKSVDEADPNLWNKRSILIAEDVEANRYLLQKVFARLGVQPDFAEDGKQACDMVLSRQAEDSTYDLIIMDMQMPIMDGYEATQFLKSKNVSTPVIALTAAALSDDVERCLSSGCDQVLVKPVNVAELRSLFIRYFE